MSGDGPRSLYSAARYLSRSEAEALAKRALGFSTAEQARVSINSGVRGNTRFAVNQISTAGDNYNVSVTVLSTFGKRSASVTTNRTLRRVAGAAGKTVSKVVFSSPRRRRVNS